jgi:hypothetical protein
MQLMKVSEVAKEERKSRNQIRGLIQKHGIKSIEKRVTPLGITNFYNIEDFKQWQ